MNKHWKRKLRNDRVVTLSTWEARESNLLIGAAMRITRSMPGAGWAITANLIVAGVGIDFATHHIDPPKGDRP